ncbi:hypothetical protein [Catenulispora yoronensis]
MLHYTWAAHEGQGRVGTWTATRVVHLRDSKYYGRFVSDDGAEVREDIRLEHPDSALAPGESVRAVDIGRSSVAVLGGDEWELAAGIAAVSGLVSAAWVLTVPLAPVVRLVFRRREAPPDSPSIPAPARRRSPRPTPARRLAEIQAIADDADHRFDELLSHLHTELQPEPQPAAPDTRPAPSDPM